MAERIAEAEIFRDDRRMRWLFALFAPCFAIYGTIFWLASGQAALLWLPVVIFYGLIPLLDALVGGDPVNMPEHAVAAIEADPFYRRITYAQVPLLWAILTFNLWFIARHDLPWHGVLAVILATGFAGGLAINLGHELGHKRSPLERWLAKLILAPTFYGHFYVEHNRGHHRDVATPDDSASSRMGESIYRFLLREMPGAFRRGWELEADRMRRHGKSPWSLENEVLQPLAITMVYWAGLLFWLGLPALMPLLAIVFWSNFQLTSANYVEHYGLLRRLLPNGRRELCQPEHSWNSNHAISNWALFHLQRHADHHCNPARRYQSLRHLDQAPQLPSGYFTMFLVAYFPAWWFRLMDPRLLAAVGRDPDRINFDPSRRDALLQKYHLVAKPATGAAVTG